MHSSTTSPTRLVLLGLAILGVIALALFTASSAHADDTPATYDWTGGLLGYSGTVVLDSDSNASGSLSDILSATITTPGGTFDLDDPDSIDPQLFTSLFSWNPEEITSMGLMWWIEDPRYDPGDFGWAILGEGLAGFPGLGNVVESNDVQVYEDADCAWVRDPGQLVAGGSVPDGCSCLLLLMLVFPAILFATARRA